MGRAAPPQLPGEGTQGPFCILPATVCLSVLHWTPVIQGAYLTPALSARPYRALHGGGVGVAKDTGSAFWGPVGQSRVGIGSRRKGHSEVAEKPPLPAPAAAPPLPPASKEKSAGEGWGGGEAAESALCCLPRLWRAEQAVALDTQPPPLARLT